MCLVTILITISENIKDFHHYTNTSAETAAAAVNAGVSLEDANLEANVFTHLGEAILQVRSTVAPFLSNYNSITGTY